MNIIIRFRQAEVTAHCGEFFTIKLIEQASWDICATESEITKAPK